MQMVVSRAHPPDCTPMFFKLASLKDIECLFVSPILLVGLSCHLFYVKLGQSPCRSLPLTPQWSQSYDSQVPDPILRRLANKCAITCQQCQAHGRSGQCLGQRQDHAQGPSKLRKSPPTGFSQMSNRSKLQDEFVSWLELVSHWPSPWSSSPATFAPSLSIRTPSPSHHLCLSSRQSPQQSLDCKFLKIEQKRFREKLHDICLPSAGDRESRVDGQIKC